MNKILVTGAAGYLGRVLTSYLGEDGFIVKGIDNFMYGQKDLTGEIIKGSIDSLIDMYKATKDVDVVVALAAIVGDAVCDLDKEQTILYNTESVKLLIDACEYNGVKKIIFASSCSVYGESQDKLDEISTTLPLSSYAASKIAAEQIFLERVKNCEAYLLRFGTLFGYSPRMRFDLVANIMTAMAMVEKKIVVYGGSQWRPMVHIADVAEAIRLCIDADLGIGKCRIYNVVGTNYTVKDMAERIANTVIKRIGEPVEVIEKEGKDDFRNYNVLADRIRKELNFEAVYSLEDGVKIMIELAPFLDYKNDKYYNVNILSKLKV